MRSGRLLVVRVQYTASPVAEKAAVSAAMTLAEKAILAVFTAIVNDIRTPAS